MSYWEEVLTKNPHQSGFLVGKDISVADLAVYQVGGGGGGGGWGLRVVGVGGAWSAWGGAAHHTAPHRFT